jgi:hypothetical protein
MKKILILLAAASLVSGCLSLNNGVEVESFPYSKEYDELYYCPTMQELKDYSSLFLACKEAMPGTKWDCDDIARSYVNKFKRVYSYKKGTAESVATYPHMIAVVQTSDAGLVYVEPQTGKILKEVD